MRSLADCVDSAVLLLIDYGFPASEYYHPQRHRGTLMCHYRHHSHDDPFFWPGLQDITTHVDFSAIWAAADAAGWQLEATPRRRVICWTPACCRRCKRWSLARPSISGGGHGAKLVSPAEMGELFKMIAFSRHLALDALLPGFAREDRSGGCDAAGYSCGLHFT